MNDLGVGFLVICVAGLLGVGGIHSRALRKLRTLCEHYKVDFNPGDEFQNPWGKFEVKRDLQEPFLRDPFQIEKMKLWRGILNQLVGWLLLTGFALVAWVVHSESNEARKVKPSGEIEVRSK